MLSDKQYTFAKNVAILFMYLIAHGVKFTLGEAYRPQEMQEIYLKQDKTKVKYSRHSERLAIDINIFGDDNRPVYDKADLQEIGDFWENLDARNQWGGNFYSFIDTPHFEMT